MNTSSAVFRHQRHRRILFCACFGVVFAGLLAILPEQGLTDDDDFYAPRRRKLRWLGL